MKGRASSQSKWRDYTCRQIKETRRKEGPNVNNSYIKTKVSGFGQREVREVRREPIGVVGKGETRAAFTRSPGALVKGKAN